MAGIVIQIAENVARHHAGEHTCLNVECINNQDKRCTSDACGNLRSLVITEIIENGCELLKWLSKQNGGKE